MSKRQRSWDKGSHRKGLAMMARKKQAQQVPSVEIDKTVFWSDRFYLNQTNNTAAAAADLSSNHDSPWFDRSALVESLDLKAAILGTYTMEPEVLSTEFPTLLGPRATIPTLVLHGKKGWNAEKKTSVQEEEDSDREEEEEEEVDDCTVNTQEMETVRVAKSYSNTLSGSENEKKEYSGFPSTVHFSEITSSWIQPKHFPLSRDGPLLDPLTGALAQHVLDKRTSCRGVHHPKFLILVETSGSVVVVVSTANMTLQKTMDASWVQRFPPRNAENNNNQSNNNNDFGETLADFLHCQMLSTRKGQFTTLAFLQRYGSVPSIQAFTRQFDFTRAQVHLIPTVPGSRGGSYSRRRVARLLQQQADQMPLSDQDRLIVQPTSVGSDWTTHDMCQVVESYLQEPDALTRMDLVWPSEQFVQEALSSSSPTSVAHADWNGSTSDAEDADPDCTVPDEKANAGYLFLGSDTFNRIDLNCISQMVMYDSDYPVVPHFKSVARLFKGHDHRLRRDFGKSQSYFSWFLLTSACLSRGAQGVGTDLLDHQNFELGVLFTSCLKGPNPRLYCHQPSKSARKPSALIHLPVPYCCLRFTPYQESPDEADFCETPYFHEITPGTACVGNMRLTPYGAAVAAQKKNL